ncbi:MAG: HIT family protein [Bacilli bacterium]|jgi:histidine triad (HIT) family protein|nr:HIT family protein [Bacilli bacterium]MDD3349133.1 HIT family protein [Bacilli bacterium]MDD4057129.1 HIT family protein [Bacilli bacterium]MDY0209082.1 HIT family protein [Bacilli bacterium]
MCVFCKIAKGEIPAYKVYEDHDFLAFLDLSQATIGHVLVIPKVHYETITSLEEENDIFNVVIKLTKAITALPKVEGVNILSNNGTLAGQTIPHFHIHIIPRYPNDRIQIKFGENTLSPEDLFQLANKIKKNSSL